MADAGSGLGVSAIVAAKVDSEIAANVVDRNGDEEIVDVVPSQMRVAVGGDHFENSIVKLENRNVESAAAEIVNDDHSVLFLIETVSKRRGGGFVNEAQDV